MRNFKLSTRIVVIFSIILGIAVLFVLWNKVNEQKQIAVEPLLAPTNGSLSIKVDGFGFFPFDIMYISGAGFDPEAATSVVYTTYGGEVLTVPALRVTPNSIEVAVPPISYNKIRSAFFLNQTSLKVVQAKKVDSKLIVKTSNQSSYFMVYAPKTPSVMKRPDALEMPSGTITREFVAVSIDSLATAISNLSGENIELKASYVKAKLGMENLLVALDKYIKNPNLSIKLQTTDEGIISLDAAKVAWLDAFYSGLLGLAEDREMLVAQNNSWTFIPTAEAAETGCGINTKLGQTASTIVAAQINCLHSKSIASQPRSLYERLEFGKNIDMWIIVGSLGLGIATAGLSIEAQIGCAVVFAIITSQMKDGESADVDSLPSYWGAVIGDYIDHIKDIPIIGDLSNMADVYKEKCRFTPSDMCNKVEALLSWPSKMLLYLNNGDANAFQMPADQLAVALDSIGSKEGGPELLRYTPIQPVKKSPVKTTPSNATPSEKTPAKIAPVNTAPVKTTPISPGPTCSQLREKTHKTCLAGCSSSDSCYTDYSACTPSCEGTGDLLKNLNCVNSCLGVLSKCTDASSKCITDCNNNKSATQCP